MLLRITFSRLLGTISELNLITGFFLQLSSFCRRQEKVRFSTRSQFSSNSGAVLGPLTCFDFLYASCCLFSRWHNELSIRTLQSTEKYAWHMEVYSPNPPTKMAALSIQPHLLKWMHSHLSSRQQRVKIENVYSDWVTLLGGMPQGTWLGSYAFIIPIQDLNTIKPIFKFVDMLRWLKS